MLTWRDLTWRERLEKLCGIYFDEEMSVVTADNSQVLINELVAEIEAAECVVKVTAEAIRVGVGEPGQVSRIEVALAAYRALREKRNTERSAT